MFNLISEIFQKYKINLLYCNNFQKFTTITKKIVDTNTIGPMYQRNRHKSITNRWYSFPFTIRPIIIRVVHRHYYYNCLVRIRVTDDEHTWTQWDYSQYEFAGTLHGRLPWPPGRSRKFLRIIFFEFGQFIVFVLVLMLLTNNCDPIFSFFRSYHRKCVVCRRRVYISRIIEYNV